MKPESDHECCPDGTWQAQENRLMNLADGSIVEVGIYNCVINGRAFDVT